MTFTTVEGLVNPVVESTETAFQKFRSLLSSNSESQDSDSDISLPEGTDIVKRKTRSVRLEWDASDVKKLITLNADSDIQLSLHHVIDFPSDTFVTCILIMAAAIVVIDGKNGKLKLYNHDGRFVSSTDIGMWSVVDVARVTGDHFVTCGVKKLLWWTLRENTIESDSKKYKFDYLVHGIHFDGTFYYVVHMHANAINVLDSEGKIVREIVIKEAFGKAIRFGRGICSDSATHNIYVGCYPNGVLCLSREGEPLWFHSFRLQVKGITGINGLILVSVNNGVITLTKEGEKYIVNADIDITGVDAFEKNIAVLSYIGTARKIAVLTADFGGG